MMRLIKKLLALPVKEKALFFAMLALAGIMCILLLLGIISVLPFNLAAGIGLCCLGLILLINGVLCLAPRSSLRSLAPYSFASGGITMVTAVIMLILL